MDHSTVSKEGGSNAAVAVAAKPAKSWRCDFCTVAIFAEYEDAVEHEKICDENDANNNDIAVAVSKSEEESDDNDNNAASKNAQAVAVPAPAAGAKSNSSNNKLTVARFLIQNLRGKKGYATTDFQIDLILEKHGLYHLVSTVFDILLEENLSEEGIEAHLWSIKFAGTNFENGWRSRKRDGTFDRPANPNEVDEGELRILSSLATPIENGQKGRIAGECLTCDVVVQAVSSFGEVNEDDVVVKVDTLFDKIAKIVRGKREEEEDEGVEDVGNNKKPRYPKVTKIESKISGSVEDDWIKATEKTKCARLQNAWDVHYQGYNSWKRDRITGEHIRGKPISPEWGPAEREIMGLLINSNAKFKKCWTNILQYAFPDRKEGGTSVRWYQLKKRDYFMIEYKGRGLTNDARIRLAKRLARKRMKGFIEQGFPRREPHPDARIERELRKRGKIDDNTSGYERMRLCAMYRGIY